MNRFHDKLAGQTLWLDAELAQLMARRGLWRRLTGLLRRRDEAGEAQRARLAHGLETMREYLRSQ